MRQSATATPLPPTADAYTQVQKAAAYSHSRQVNEFRLYMEAMDKILPNVKKILLGSRVKINNAELWLSNNANTTNGGTN
jgi:membrane protease subunit HflK